MNAYHVKLTTGAGTVVRNVIAGTGIEALRLVLNLADKNIDGPFCFIVKPTRTFIEDASTHQPEAA